MWHERLPLADRTRGHWRHILMALGALDAKALSGRNRPCPWCGGKDRFRWTNHEDRGGFVCSQCGTGDGAEIVKRHFGIEYAEAARKIEAVLGEAPAEPKPNVDEAALRKLMNNLWQRGEPVKHSDPVGRYLRSRGLDARVSSNVIRYVAEAHYRLEDRTYTFPAMIAKVFAPDGRPCQLHRTFLTPDGGKANVDDPRRLMKGPLSKGSSVRLMPPGEKLIVAEGIETALAASKLLLAPACAALNAGNLREFVPPEGVSHIAIAGDNDASFTGQAAAYALAQRLRRDGFEVSVHVPPDPDTDWNDVLRSISPAA